MAWYKFWKKSGPAALLSERYLWLDKETYSKEKDVEAECEYWAERTGGGHNTHYLYGFEEIPNPPQSVLEKMISDEERTIKHHRDYLKFLRQTQDLIRQ